MHVSFLLEAGAVLGALGLAGLLFHRARQSVVPAYILLGLVLRPWVSGSAVERLATVGVVLLLFFMGLEFSLGALVRQRRTILRTGSIDWIVCFPVGLVGGLALGFGLVGSLLLAGAVYVSSSAIIAKGVIELRRAAAPETELALGILVFEDLFIALFLVVVTGAVLAPEPAAGPVLLGIAKALVFVGLVLLLAARAGPLLGRVLDITSDDIFLLLIGAVVLLLSWSAAAVGLSEAIGAFVAGLALAETPEKERVERLFAPLQGLFAAIFFLGFGLTLDASAFRQLWAPVLSLTGMAVLAKALAGWWAGLASGAGPRTALALGLTLVPRGEFSIILAGVAAAAGLTELAALIGLAVLALSLLGTIALQLAPAVGRRLFPARMVSLEPAGAMADIATPEGPEVPGNGSAEV
ncbi:MAG: cation:proton antiporter [Gemmatimonadota bacterium]